MLTIGSVSGFGYGFGGAPSLVALIDAARARAQQRNGAGLGRIIVRRGGGLGGLGTPAGDFRAFNNGQSTPSSFVGGTVTPNAVFCSKDSAFRPQCVLNQAGGGQAQIQGMQQAIDGIINLIPTNALAGQQLQGQLPTGDGTTTSLQTFTIPSNLSSPIGTSGGGGYDGIVGDTTTKFGVIALTLAGMLEAFPNPGISAAFVDITRNDVWAEFSGEIASFLNDVAGNFGDLLAAFAARGNTPVQTQLDVSTIPFVVSGGAAPPSNKLAIGATAAAMIGLTAIGAISAGKHAPATLYDDHPKPALGRGRRSRRKPRGW